MIHQRRLHCWQSVVCLLAASCGGESSEVRSGELTAQPQTNLLYFSETRSQGTTSQLLRESGDLTTDMRDRARAPWLFVGEELPLLSEGIEVVYNGDGSETVRYELEEVPHQAVAAQPDDRPLEISATLTNLAASLPPNALIDVTIKLRNFPQWDLPSPLDPRRASAGELSDRNAERAVAMSERTELALQMSVELRNSIEADGGTVRKVIGGTGWVYARVPAAFVSTLTSRDDIVRVYEDGPMYDNACISSPTCTLGGAGTWRLGEGGTDERVGFHAFHSAGYTGELSNSAFHSWGDINVAVMERLDEQAWEDEARWFLDTSTGPSRIVKRMRCDTGTDDCDPESNFADSDVSNDHPMWVTSIIVSDLEQNQAYNASMGDACWSGSGDHCADWETAGSGLAPEASVQLWANTHTGSTLNDAILGSISYNPERPDVINLSTSHHETFRCNEASSYIFEDAVEAAYAEGVLVVNGPENAGSGSPTGPCNLDSPGDIPTSFTVNGIATNTSGCQSDYQSCQRSTGSSAVGGITVNAGGANRTRAMSAIDMQAPGIVSFYGDDAGAVGQIMTNTVGGTSIAAPHVAGAAALVKHWQLATGHSWINSPGRLHTVMLAMGDRHEGGTQTVEGFDYVHGAGKLKLRPLWNLTPSAAHMKTHTTSSTGSYSYYPFSSPMPSGVEMVKCVMQEHEYMASKADVSDAYLNVTIFHPTYGFCSGGGTTIYANSDPTYDLKHQVAVPIPWILPGRCVQVTLTRRSISSAGSSSASVYCYYAGEMDDEPN